MQRDISNEESMNIDTTGSDAGGSDRPLRLLSLLPSATEIIYALGAESSLVGLTHECDYPPAAASRDRVTSSTITPDMPSDLIDDLVRSQLADSGTLYRLDMDLVRRLAPEIVLTQQLCTVCAVGFETVRGAMLSLPNPPRVVNLEPHTLSEVFDTVMTVAGLLGIPERGTEVVAALRGELAAIPHAPDAPDVLFLEWVEPFFSAGHWVPELVTAAGGRPVLANPGRPSRPIAESDLEEAGFQVVVVSCCGFSLERAMVDVDRSPFLNRLAAERPDLRLIVFDGNHYFSRPGPRLVESARLLSAALRGRPFDEESPSIVPPYRELRR